MPDLPGPPGHYDDEQRAAWLDGAATIASLLGQQGRIIAGRYGDAASEESVADSDDRDGDQEDGETCPNCGGALLDAMGGDVCLKCGNQSE